MGLVAQFAQRQRRGLIDGDHPEGQRAQIRHRHRREVLSGFECGAELVGAVEALKFSMAAVPADIRKLTRPIHWTAESTDVTPRITGGPPASAAATASSKPSKVPNRQVLVSSANATTLSLVTTLPSPGGSGARTAPPTAAAP